ncbi:hypothetical protein HK105_207121 [Polyrhizophydium stewartii]|uniref:Uncharacterized protein n=1 Tax=Polyrhizophydium stewartii TaxID=2732419 RepID=A0ABR4N1I0_9FUNG
MVFKHSPETDPAERILGVQARTSRTLSFFGAAAPAHAPRRESIWLINKRWNEMMSRTEDKRPTQMALPMPDPSASNPSAAAVTTLRAAGDHIPGHPESRSTAEAASLAKPRPRVVELAADIKKQLKPKPADTLSFDEAEGAPRKTKTKKSITFSDTVMCKSISRVEDLLATFDDECLGSGERDGDEEDDGFAQAFDSDHAAGKRLFAEASPGDTDQVGAPAGGVSLSGRAHKGSSRSHRPGDAGVHVGDKIDPSKSVSSDCALASGGSTRIRSPLLATEKPRKHDKKSVAIAQSHIVISSTAATPSFSQVPGTEKRREVTFNWSDDEECDDGSDETDESPVRSGTAGIRVDSANLYSSLKRFGGCRRDRIDSGASKVTNTCDDAESDPDGNDGPDAVAYPSAHDCGGLLSAMAPPDAEAGDVHGVSKTLHAVKISVSDHSRGRLEARALDHPASGLAFEPPGRIPTRICTSLSPSPPTSLPTAATGRSASRRTRLGRDVGVRFDLAPASHKHHELVRPQSAPPSDDADALLKAFEQDGDLGMDPVLATGSAFGDPSDEVALLDIAFREITEPEPPRRAGPTPHGSRPVSGSLITDITSEPPAAPHAEMESSAALHEYDTSFHRVVRLQDGHYYHAECDSITSLAGACPTPDRSRSQTPSPTPRANARALDAAESFLSAVETQVLAEASNLVHAASCRSFFGTDGDGIECLCRGECLARALVEHDADPTRSAASEIRRVHPLPAWNSSVSVELPVDGEQRSPVSLHMREAAADAPQTAASISDADLLKELEVLLDMSAIPMPLRNMQQRANQGLSDASATQDLAVVRSLGVDGPPSGSPIVPVPIEKRLERTLLMASTSMSPEALPKQQPLPASQRTQASEPHAGQLTSSSTPSDSTLASERSSLVETRIPAQPRQSGSTARSASVSSRPSTKSGTARANTPQAGDAEPAEPSPLWQSPQKHQHQQHAGDANQIHEAKGPDSGLHPAKQLPGQTQSGSQTWISASTLHESVGSLPRVPAVDLTASARVDPKATAVTAAITGAPGVQRPHRSAVWVMIGQLFSKSPNASRIDGKIAPMG